MVLRGGKLGSEGCGLVGEMRAEGSLAGFLVRVDAMESARWDRTVLVGAVVVVVMSSLAVALEGSSGEARQLASSTGIRDGLSIFMPTFRPSTFRRTVERKLELGRAARMALLKAGVWEDDGKGWYVGELGRGWAKRREEREWESGGRGGSGWECSEPEGSVRFVVGLWVRLREQVEAREATVAEVRPWRRWWWWSAGSRSEPEEAAASSSSSSSWGV